VIALKLAKTIDRQGLYLELAAIKQQIQVLPLIPFRPNTRETEATATPIQKPSLETPWYDSVWNSIKNAFGNIDRFVQVRDLDQAPELLFSEKRQLRTINHLTLMLEQAQFALLHEEEMIYRNSLEEAVKWWDNYYSHYSEHEIIRSEIKNLQKETIIQTLPDISRSSELLTDYIERFHKLNNTTLPSTTNSSKPQVPTPLDNANTRPNVSPETNPITNEAISQEPQS
jgi:uroporphyrin-3 C-methyltransferase